jgi:hypothetical protein
MGFVGIERKLAYLWTGFSLLPFLLFLCAQLISTATLTDFLNQRSFSMTARSFLRWEFMCNIG